MSEQLISVIVPIYNVEKYLRECLDSIINQTYKNLEIILVDDGSPDNCGKICDEYAKKDKRVKTIHKINDGVSEARNSGIKEANGKWIMFVDGDDWLENDTIEVLLRNSNANDIIIGQPFIDNVPSKFIKKSGIVDDKNLLIESFFMDKNENYHYVESVWAKLYRSDMIMQNELQFNKKLKIGEDLVFNYYAYKKANSIFYLNECVYHYRENESSVMHDISKKHIENCYDLIEYIYENFTEIKDGILFDAYIYRIVRKLDYFCEYCIFNKNISFIEKKNMLKDICNNSIYKLVIKSAKISDLYNKRRMILILLLKLKMFSLIGVLYYFIARRKSKQNLID